MTSYSGSVAYLKYVALSDKPEGFRGTEFNSVFGLGKMTDDRVNYTSQIIVEGGETPSLDVVENGLVYEDNGAVKNATFKVIKSDGSYEYVGAVADAVLDAGVTVEKIAYVAKKWQMNEVPAEDIPTIGPKMEHIPLVAEPRRIAVRYDQITA